MTDLTTSPSAAAAGRALPAGRPVTLTVQDLRCWAELDSRGFPTIAVALQEPSGQLVTSSAPAGASTGAHEARELRGGGEGWGRLGANSVVATSMTGARAFALEAGQELYQWIAEQLGRPPTPPVPHFNVINGGAHAANRLAFQEFMIAPVGARSASEAVRMGAEVFHALGALVRARFDGGIGDEGGYAPPLEDGYAEDDEEGWRIGTAAFGERAQVVGDGLYVTSPSRIRAGARRHLSTAALIKPNQIGSVSQRLEAISAAGECGLECMVSHRSGETLDTSIAALAVGSGVGQIKAGAPARGERVAKYNRLVAIERSEPSLDGLTADEAVVGAGAVSSAGPNEKVLLVRHGRTVLNAQSRLRGHLDPELDEFGIREVAQLAEALRGSGLRQVCSSPLRRALQTAELIAHAAGVTVDVEDGLQDRDYGRWAGQPRVEVERQWGSIDAAPGVEPATAVADRVLGLLGRIAGPFPVALVSHDAVISAALHALRPELGDAADIHLGTARCSVLSRQDGTWVVEAVDQQTA